MKKFIIFLFLFVSVSAFAEKKEFAVKNEDISGISVYTGIKLNVMCGSDFSVVVDSLKAKDLENIKIFTKDNTLFIDNILSRRGKDGRHGRYDRDGKHGRYDRDGRHGVDIKTDELSVNVTLPTKQVIKKLRISSGAIVKVSNCVVADNEKLAVKLSGGSKMNISSEVESLYVKLSGGSIMNISGEVESLYVKLSGGSQFNVNNYKNLVISDVRFRVSGGSNISVCPTNDIKGKVSGGSTISFDGSNIADKKIKASGGSRIEKIDC